MKDKTATAVNMMVGMSMMMEAKMLELKKTIVPNQPLGKHKAQDYFYIFIQYLKRQTGYYHTFTVSSDTFNTK